MKIFKTLILILVLFVGFIPNIGAADKVGPQWIFLSIFNLISLFINRKEILSITKLNKIFLVQLALVLWALISFFYALNKVEVLIESSRFLILFTTCFNIYIYFRLLSYGLIKKILNVTFPLLLFGEVLFIALDFFEYKQFFFELGRQKYIQGAAANINITAFSLAIKISLCFFLLKQ